MDTGIKHHRRQLWQQFGPLGPKLRHGPQWPVPGIPLLLFCLGLGLLSGCVPFSLDRSTSKSPDVAEEPIFDLKSADEIDYRPLQSLLRQSQWRAADQETFKVLLKLRDREAEGWLSQADVDNLSCVDLQTINQLWQYYSDGHFGWWRQGEIWKSLGGVPGEYNPAVVEAFGDRVGWRAWGRWRRYDRLNFSDRAPEGHLPATTGNGVSGGVWHGVPAITYRLTYCPLMTALAEQQWVKADWETLKLFDAYLLPPLRAGDPPALGLEAIACTELRAMDQLWLQHSGGRFGLSVQTPILRKTGNQPTHEPTPDRYADFKTIVGWGIDPRVDDYNGLEPTAIPQGHFPYRLGYSYETFGSGFNDRWRMQLNPACGFY